MRGILSAAMLALTLAVSMGCGPNRWTVQSSTIFHLNPNGSGKAKIEAFLNFPFDLRPRENETETHTRVREAVAANAVQRILVETKGVDAWRDVSWRIEDDGRVRFRATVLFPDVAQAGVGSKKHAVVGLKRAAFRKTADGGTEFVMLPSKKALEREEKFRVARERRRERQMPVRDIPDEEIARRMTEERRQHSSGRELHVAIASKMKREVVLHLPGEVGKVAVFERTAEGAVRFGVDGMTAVRAMDEFYADDEQLRRYLLSGKVHDDPTPFLDPLYLLMGANGQQLAEISQATPLRAVLTGDTVALFDYGAEVDAAKRESGEPRSEFEELSPFDAIRGGSGRAIWREYTRDKPTEPRDFSTVETGYGPFRSGRYPWRRVTPADSVGGVIGKLVVPILGPLFSRTFSMRKTPDYLRYPYADETTGSAFLVPEFVDLYGEHTRELLTAPSGYQVMTEDLSLIESKPLSMRLAVSHLESGDESGTRSEYRLDLPGYCGFEVGGFHVDGRERTYFRFSNAFIMSTRAVASLDLGAAWLDSEGGDARFEWGVSADLFPRKPWLVHFSWHSLDGSDNFSETRASVGVALKALEIFAGWTRDRGPAGEKDFLEIGARLWWAF